MCFTRSPKKKQPPVYVCHSLNTSVHDCQTYTGCYFLYGELSKIHTLFILLFERKFSHYKHTTIMTFPEHGNSYILVYFQRAGSEYIIFSKFGIQRNGYWEYVR